MEDVGINARARERTFALNTCPAQSLKVERDYPKAHVMVAGQRLA